MVANSTAVLADGHAHWLDWKKMGRPQPKTRHNVCLVSSHPMVLAQFEQLLSGPAFDLKVHRLESTFAPDLRKIKVPKANVYVVDANVPRAATESLVAGILERNPAAKLLIIAERFSESGSFLLLRLGVKGLLSYSEAPGQMLRAVPQLAGGGFWVPRSVLSKFVDSMLKGDKGRRLKTVSAANLSKREQEVLEGLLENLSNKEIASRLFISERTAKFHVSNLLSKFGVRRRADLILLCSQGRAPSV
jgi:DNA-binding NarL/FixJ family response regulator